MKQQVEKLLIARIPLLPSKERSYRLAETREQQIAEYDVNDIFVESFSTTSPPAYVHNEYMITRKDREGLWGVLVDSSIREMSIKEV